MLGEPSERLFFLVGVDSTEDGSSECTRPNRVTSEGSPRVGGSTTGSFCHILQLSTFFPGFIGQGGQLLNLSMRKSPTNLAFKFLDTGILSHPLIPTSATLLVVVEQSHHVPASSSFLPKRRHDDRTRRSKEMNLKVHKMHQFVDKLQKRLCRKHVCTLHAPKEKNAMMSCCLDRKEVQCATW